jgi:hypothetical protein
MSRIFASAAMLCIFAGPAFAGPKDCTCPAMAKTGTGWCSHCKEGMVEHIAVKLERVYKAMKGSSFANLIAKGEMVKKDADIKCSHCRKLVTGHKDGYCTGCKGGLVAGRFFKGREVFDKAEHAINVMREAAKVKCDGCAVAMLTNAKCDHCKVAFKDGKKSKA